MPKLKKKKGFSGERFDKSENKPIMIDTMSFDHLDDRPKVQYENVHQDVECDKIAINQSIYDDYKEDNQMDLINIGQLNKNIFQNTCCDHCRNSKCVHLIVTKRVGLASYFQLNCAKCGFKKDFSNSKQRQYNTDGETKKLETINFSLLVGSRMAGIGYMGCKRLCTFLNLNQPPANWLVYQDILGKTFKKRSEWSRKRAALEAMLYCILLTGCANLIASFDGSWHRRGRKSIIGFVSCISLYTNKVIGIDVRSKYCPTCRCKSPCKLGDKCQINHEGSSGAMEPVGAVAIIKQIFKDYGLRITKYLGDGDSRGFAKAKAGIDWVIEKLECVNHIAKRIGSRLRKRKLEKTHMKFPNAPPSRKRLGGSGWLTDAFVNKIQQYYNWIIHGMEGDVELAKKRILAMYRHIASTDENPDHSECDPSICKYLIAQSKNESYTHKYNPKHHRHVPPFVMKEVKDIFEDLADVELLKKVAHGKTQNANECFNSTVWNILSKNGFANKKLAEWCVDMAVCVYNEGQLPVLDVLSSLGVKVGSNMAKRCQTVDKLRMSKKKKANEDSARGRGKKRTREEVDEDYQPGLCE